MTAAEKKERIIVGKVASAASDKTITVEIERFVRHPVYGKYIRRSTKLYAHDENNECGAGDTVEIVQCRPISKRKAFRLGRIVEKAK